MLYFEESDEPTARQPEVSSLTSSRVFESVKSSPDGSNTTDSLYDLARTMCDAPAPSIKARSTRVSRRNAPATERSFLSKSERRIIPMVAFLIKSSYKNHYASVLAESLMDEA